jgi:hypothetical protein
MTAYAPRRQHEDVVADAQRREPGLLSQRELDDRRTVGVLEGSPQERVRLERPLLGLEEVRLVEAQHVDLVGRDELDDLDLVAALGRQRGEVLVGQHDGLLAVVVRLVDVFVGDDLVAHLALALVADPAAVLVVDLVERDVVALGGAVDLDGHIDQAEADGALPDGSHA